MVVYLDVLFFTNVLMDWVTLLAAARLGGAKVRQGRLALASLLGGVYAAGAALLPLLAALPVRVLAGAALCLAAFCGDRADGIVTLPVKFGVPATRKIMAGLIAIAVKIGRASCRGV